MRGGFTTATDVLTSDWSKGRQPIAGSVHLWWQLYCGVSHSVLPARSRLPTLSDSLPCNTSPRRALRPRGLVNGSFRQLVLAARVQVSPDRRGLVHPTCGCADLQQKTEEVSLLQAICDLMDSEEEDRDHGIPRATFSFTRLRHVTWPSRLPIARAWTLSSGWS